MLKRILLSVLVFIATALIFLVIGALLSLLPLVSPVGAILMQYCWVIGLIGGIWFFVSGRTFWG